MQTIASKNVIIFKNGSTKQIIGFTDSVTECECCGKSNLKGTYCLDIDGVELYYGSVCAFKLHGITQEEKEVAMNEFKAKKIRVKKEEQLAIMLADGNSVSDYGKRKILAFIRKKGIDIVEFLKKHSDIVEQELNYTVYKYGCDCIVIDNK